MKKLIAQRPVLYLGRSYERGAALPAQDRLMVEAWLRAGSAVWSEGTPPLAAPPGPPGRKGRGQGGKK